MLHFQATPKSTKLGKQRTRLLTSGVHKGVDETAGQSHIGGRTFKDVLKFVHYHSERFGETACDKVGDKAR